MRASDHRCPRSSLIFIVPEASRSEGIPISGDHLHETVERNTMFFLNDQTFLQHFPQRSASSGGTLFHLATASTVPLKEGMIFGWEET